MTVGSYDTDTIHGLIPLTPEGWPKDEPLLLAKDVKPLLDELELHRRNENEDSPGPWIQRAFDALAMAQGNAERFEKVKEWVAAHANRIDHFPYDGQGGQTFVDADELDTFLKSLEPSDVAPTSVGGTNG